MRQGCFIQRILKELTHLHLMASDDATTLIVKSSKFLGRKLVVDAVPVADAVVERRRRQRARQTLLASRRREVGLAECCHAYRNNRAKSEQVKEPFKNSIWPY